MLTLGNRKVGYALGGGAARGLSHIGVLKVLEANSVIPNIIVGTSIGALVGALYAGGIKIDDIEQIALRLDMKRLMLLADVTLPMSGIIGGKRVITLLKSILGDLTFGELKYDFACVATDITTGEQVVLHDGSLIEAVRASISLPGIFTPVEMKGQYLVDGGLVNEVPVSVCRQMGADFVIGVNVIPEPSKVIQKPKKTRVVGKNKESNRVSSIVEKKLAALLSTPDEFVSTRLDEIEDGIDKFLLYHATKIQRKMLKSLDWLNLGKTKKLRRKMPGIIDVLTQTLTIAEYRVAVENLKMADLAISPRIEDIGFWQFDRAAFAVAAGEQAAKKAIKDYK